MKVATVTVQPSNSATKLLGSLKPLKDLNFVSRTSPYKGIYDWDFWKPALWKHETHSLTIPMRLIILGQLEKHNIMNFDWKHWNGQIISFILRLGFFFVVLCADLNSVCINLCRQHKSAAWLILFYKTWKYKLSFHAERYSIEIISSFSITMVIIWLSDYPIPGTNYLSSQGNLVMAAKSPDERDNWIKILQECSKM